MNKGSKLNNRPWAEFSRDIYLPLFTAFYDNNG